MHADLFLPLRRHARIMSATWIRRTNTRIDFPIVYVSSRGIYAERKGSFRLLFSVAVTEANSGRHFRMFHERSRKISYILVYNINFYRESF